MRANKRNLYRNQKEWSWSNLQIAYTEIGDGERASYYERFLATPAESTEEKMMSGAEAYEETQKKIDDWVEKRYGKQIANRMKESKTTNPSMKEIMQKAAERQRFSEDIMAEMDRRAAEGDKEGIGDAISRLWNLWTADYQGQEGVDWDSINTNLYPTLADFALKYGLYEEAVEYSRKGFDAGERMYAQFSRYAKKAFFATDKERIMAQGAIPVLMNRMKAGILTGTALNHLERFSEAIPFLRQATEQKELGYGMWGGMSLPQDPRIESFRQLSIAYEGAGMVSEAIESAYHLVDYFEGIRGRLFTEKQKISYLGVQYEVYDRLIRLLLDQNRVVEAFECLERSKARAFVDLLAGRNLEPRDEHTKRLYAERSAVERRYFDIGQIKRSDQEGERSIQVIAKDWESLVNKMTDQDREFLSTTTVSTLAITDIQALLDGNTALAAYCLGMNRQYVWLITSNDVKVRPIDVPLWAIADKIMAFREEVSQPPTGKKRLMRKSKRPSINLRISPERFRNGDTYRAVVTVENGVSLYLTIEEAAYRIGAWSNPFASLISRDVKPYGTAAVFDRTFKWRIAPGRHQVTLKTDQGTFASNTVIVEIDDKGNVTVADEGYSGSGGITRETASKFDNVSLYDILIGPISEDLACRRLGVIPQGILHYVPFAALRKGERSLIQDRAVFYLPSATVLKYCRDKSRVFGGTILAMGNPDLSESGLDLPFAGEEVRSIAAMFSGTMVFLGGEATEGAFFDNAPAADVIHLACHGLFDVEKPMNSMLMLAPEGDTDGRLTVREIFDLRLKASIVTLSACQSGMSRVRAGDELMGLPRAFIYAGAPSVTASLWNVNDRAALVLMNKFYQCLQTLGSAEALQQAQLDMIGSETYRHPFYWAAFTVTGDYL